MLRNLLAACGVAAVLAAAPALAAEPAHDMQAMGHAAVTGEGAGTVKSVDAAKRSVVIEHGPIASLQWPGMTMPFAVKPGIDLAPAKPGAKVAFTVEKQADGSFAIIRLAAQ